MNRSAAAPPAEVGRYAMVGQIGSGGMATVHLGRGPGGEVVAIKRLKPHLVAEPDVVQSFLDEARLSACVRHANVVTTLDVVTHQDEACLVMEYVEGVSLAALVRARTDEGAAATPPDLAVAVLIGALRGLHAAHEAVSDTGEPLHIVHRDVSPHNIMVGVDGTARVLDFGVAKALGRLQTTRDGKIKGKLGYMAPEQLSGRGVTRRTDIFAAGIVLWELLTGDRLFHTDEEATTVTRVLMARVRAPSELCPAIPTALDRVVLRALERDPSKRFLTAEDMAHALGEALAAAPQAAVGVWVRAAASDELARRAALLHADTALLTERSGVVALASTDASGSATFVESPPAAAPRRRRRTLGVVSLTLAVVLCGWGALSRSRSKGTDLATTALSPAQTTFVDASSAPPPSAPAPPLGTPPPPTPTIAATAPASPSVGSPPPKVPSRRAAPKPPSPKATASAREKLYSRD
jgi:serine/threonine-protein kinase